MLKRLISFYSTVREQFSANFVELNKTREVCRDLPTATSTELALGELADTLYALREIATLLEDSAKETRKLMTDVNRIFCSLWIEHSLANPGDAQDNVKTAYCTATPDVKAAVKLPTLKGDAESYVALMRNMIGCEADYLRQIPDGEGGFTIAELVRPHWPGIMSLVAHLASQGEPLPDGLKQEEMFKTYDVKIRKKKEIA